MPPQRKRNCPTPPPPLPPIRTPEYHPHSRKTYANSTAAKRHHTVWHIYLIRIRQSLSIAIRAVCHIQRNTRDVLGHHQVRCQFVPVLSANLPFSSFSLWRDPSESIIIMSIVCFCNHRVLVFSFCTVASSGALTQFGRQVANSRVSMYCSDYGVCTILACPAFCLI